MNPTTYITTSWDDGHPLDLRVAELLTKYRLRGTFYVPMTAENETMTAAQIRELSLAFEIGAHTLHHAVLTERPTSWLGKRSPVPSPGSKNTGLPCLMFCPPEGKYSSRHLEMVRRAGYLGLRSVELGSLDFPRRKRASCCCRQRFRLTHTASSLSPGTRLSEWPSGISGGSLLMVARPNGPSWRDRCCARPSDTAACSICGVIHGSCRKPASGNVWMKLLRFMSEFASQAPLAHQRTDLPARLVVE